MNSFHNSVKYMRLINIKSTFNILKECQLRRTIVENSNTSVKAKTLSFAPRCIGVEITNTKNVGNKQQDPIPYIPIINPRSILPLIDINWKKEEIDLPAIHQEEIQAERLIVIRRKKMKKHQRRKLWKRMRHRWAKIKQNRRQIKEKIFQNELLAMVKSANEFSAEKYVADKLEKANHIPLPTRWRHKKLPEFIIRQLLGIDKKINYKHTDVYKA
ncbi:hypothetical protein ACJJTC_012298 [Scirpophaga incertulas]